MTVRVESFPDDEWALQAAKRLTSFIGEHPKARICLPTGATVEPVYPQVARFSDLRYATVFLLDEFGGLPPADPGRCRSMIQRHLLDHAVGSPTLHAPDVDAADLDSECGRYRSLLRDGLDLAVVGLGANGHIGMNEPGSPADSVTRVVKLARTTSEHASEYGASTNPTWGITMGLQEILAAGEVWLLVTGRHKRDILARVMDAPISPQLPGSLLRRHRAVTVITDASAGG